jgi:hypothetical protein
MRLTHPLSCRALALQVPLPLTITTKPKLVAPLQREAIVCVLARLLLEAARPLRSEGNDDAP